MYLFFCHFLYTPKILYPNNVIVKEYSKMKTITRFSFCSACCALAVYTYASKQLSNM